MDTSEDTLQVVDYEFVGEWRTKIGYRHLDLVNLDPGPDGRIVWQHVSPLLLRRIRESHEPVACAEMEHDGNGVWINADGMLEVRMPPGPAPRFFIDPKHSILLINWNIHPEEDRLMTRLEFVQAIEMALASLDR
jgi:hypothetical protein